MTSLSKLVDQPPAFGGERDQTPRPSTRSGGAGHKPAPLRPVDQPTDAGLRQLEMAGELEHPRLAVAQDAEQPQLRDREVVGGRDPAQHALDGERELHDGVDQARGPLLIWHDGECTCDLSRHELYWFVTRTTLWSPHERRRAHLRSVRPATSNSRAGPGSTRSWSTSSPPACTPAYAPRRGTHYNEHRRAPAGPRLRRRRPGPPPASSCTSSGRTPGPAAMPEQTSVDRGRSAPLPEDPTPPPSPPAMNPAMSSWVALRRRSSSGPGRACSSSAPAATPGGWRSRSPATSAPRGWWRPWAPPRAPRPAAGNPRRHQRGVARRLPAR